MQHLGHSSLVWYLIAMCYYMSTNYVLCLQSIQKCLSDLEGREWRGV